MRYSKTILKSILLSTTIFWTVIFSEDFDTNMLFWAFISMIPITLCCSLTIMFTISPWFYINAKVKPQDVYKRYFPYYAIICFSICVYAIWKNNFDIYAISFFSSACLTLMQTWNWLVTDNQGSQLINK